MVATAEIWSSRGGHPDQNMKDRGDDHDLDREREKERDDLHSRTVGSAASRACGSDLEGRRQAPDESEHQPAERASKAAVPADDGGGEGRSSTQ